MARSERGRARQQARRDAYADGVLSRIAARTKGDVHMMPWGNELAAVLPNHLTMAQRNKIVELRETSPIGAMKLLVQLTHSYEHASEAGKVTAPRAGKAGPVTRTDTSIVPSWDKGKSDTPAVVHTCTGDDGLRCEACASDKRREQLVRARRTH